MSNGREQVDVTRVLFHRFPGVFLHFALVVASSLLNLVIGGGELLVMLSLLLLLAVPTVRSIRITDRGCDAHRKPLEPLLHLATDTLALVVNDLGELRVYFTQAIHDSRTRVQGIGLKRCTSIRVRKADKLVYLRFQRWS